jgi:glutaredoxin
MAKEFLSRKGVEYVELDVSRDRAALDEMVRLAGALSVPVITACEQVLIGFDQQRLEQMINCVKQRSQLPSSAMP